ITVGACDIARAELPASIINCDSLGVRFQNEAVASGIFAYFWDFGVNSSSSDTSNLPTPLFQYPDTGVYRAKLVVNRGGDCPDSTFTEVRVFPGFAADFSVQGVCQQLPYQFTDRTQARYGVVNSWRWDFGQTPATNDTSRLRNPAFLYGSAGNYTVTLIAGSSKGCIDTLQRVVAIAAEPVLELAFKDTLICSIDSLQLRGLSPGSYSWSPSNRMSGSNTPNPIVFPTQTTTYRATLNNAGCIASDTVRVRVLDFITVELGADTSICLTDAVTLRPSTEALSFSWQPAGLFDNAAVKNATLRPTATSTVVRLQANLGKCQAEDSLVVRTVPYPLADAGRDTAICFGTATTLQGSGNGSSLRWSPAASLRQPGSYSTIATPRGTTAYVLTVTDTLGCPKPVRDTVLVTVYPRINVFAGNDTTAVRGQPLLLRGTADGADLRWSPTTWLSGANTANPTFNVPVQTALSSLGDYYNLTLTATSPQGCTATDELRIRLFERPAIYVPTAFTPNADGLNDALRPTLAGMRQLQYFRIFNRYGQLVFETRTEGLGWDGRLNGQPQPAGAYVYQCQAIDYLGNQTDVKGNFVLIR
ncbi:MAG: PKD domain-containing protein, partial [Chitinophagaceae bacterium]|nr:PKD domain-containing protein [Chitinophagaceae bacterium]